MKRSSLWASRVGLVVCLAGIALLVVLNFNRLPRAEARSLAATASTARPSYLYRYDPASQSFLTITLANNAAPIGVALTGTNPTQIWIAEYGLNRVSRVTFTSTVDYAQTAYPITSTANSRPYRLTVDGNDVWFTERGANRVGRLNAVTGELDEFYGHGLSLDAGLSDIKVTSDGAVWIGGQTVRRLIKLTVNSPSNYTFTEYTDTLRPNFVVAPAFLAIDDSDQIWLTVPESTYYQIAQVTPSTQDFVWPTLPFGSQLQGVVAIGGYAWAADQGRNTLDQVQYETTPRVNSFGPITRPMEIAAASSRVFWVTQDDGRGAIAQFVYTSVVSFQISSTALPVSGLQLAGIAAAVDGSVWVAAHAPVRVYLPVMRRDS